MWPRSHCYLEINLKERLSILISNLLIEITVEKTKKQKTVQTTQCLNISQLVKIAGKNYKKIHFRYKVRLV